MRCRRLWNIINDESFHSDVFSEADFMYSTKKSENKDTECIFCNGKFSEDEQLEILIKCLSWTLLEQRTQNISVTLTNRLEAEMVFA